MKEKINAVYTYAYQQMSFKFLPTQTPNSTSFLVFTQKSFWVIFTNKILPYTLANKIKNKDVPLGVIHISSNPHQLTNHIIPNRIMGSRCDYAKNQKWLHQAMLRFQVYFDVNFLLVLSFQFSKSESCFRLIQIFQN